MKRPSRWPRRALIALTVVAALATAFQVVRPRLERSIRSRIEREAVRRGLLARVDTVRVGLWPPVALTGLRLERPGSWTAETDGVVLTLRLAGSGLLGRTRLALGQATIHGPAGLSLAAQPTVWDLSKTAEGGWRVDLRRPATGLAVAWSSAPEEGRIEVTAAELPAGGPFSLCRHGRPLVDPGPLSGRLHLTRRAGATEVDLTTGGRLRVASLGSDGSSGEAGFGEPAEVAMRLTGSWRPAEGALRVERWSLAVDQAELRGSLAVTGIPDDPAVDLSLEAERLDLARLLRTSGVEQAVVSPADPSGDLGSASLGARFRGRVADPASFTVSQRLDFTPPRRMPPAIARLTGDFRHDVALRGGGRKTIEVAAGSPDFIALEEVPPLFIRTLLLGEDAGFHGHRGIDLAELPSAILTNWARGGTVRGASTITQQLAKNLFLSREKRLSRKLQELSLALLLEASLGKRRILEVYLNVIEWGPGVYGLRPAARRYFGREPGELTAAQMAFLVALIPGPVKYQTSFAGGTVSAGFRPLVDDLLAKLRSVGALDEAQYQAALAEELVVDAAPEDPVH